MSLIGMELTAPRSSPLSPLPQTSMNTLGSNFNISGAGDYIRCARCRHPGCDLQVSACGCSFHAVSDMCHRSLVTKWHTHPTRNRFTIIWNTNSHVQLILISSDACRWTQRRHWRLVPLVKDHAMVLFSSQWILMRSMKQIKQLTLSPN